jgi:pyruvate/2-oxoglutarate dehydrogenase complex dihydrolipoamide acyltransferase (E2) component
MFKVTFKLLWVFKLFLLFGYTAYVQSADSKYTIVLSGCLSGVYDSSNRCIKNPTPEQKNQSELREKKKQEESSARKKLQQQAEQQKIIAQRAREAEHKRAVDAQLKLMGGSESRRVEAERLVMLREKADAALASDKSCKEVTQSYQLNRIGSDEMTARFRMKEAMSNSAHMASCGNSPLIDISPVICKNTSLNPVQLPKPPVGGCLACISEDMATKMYGWKKGVGYPIAAKGEAQWTCSITTKCKQKSCGSGNVRAM